VNEGTLQVEEVEFVVETAPGGRDCSRVGQHARATSDIGQVTTRDVGKGFVADAELETGGVPVNEQPSPASGPVGGGGGTGGGTAALFNGSCSMSSILVNDGSSILPLSSLMSYSSMFDLSGVRLPVVSDLPIETEGLPRVLPDHERSLQM
jgi:hypothetical protein